MARRLLLALSLLLPIAVPAVALAGSEDTSRTFLQHVQRGDFERARRLLEDARHRGQPRGGDDAYFVYESGYEPNLAFLVGHTFVPGTAAVTTQRSDWYLLDGTMYATVTLPLRFADDARPWLLPPATSFGRRMRMADFLAFVSAPERYPEHLTLRLRPGLASGRARSRTPHVAPAPVAGASPVTVQPPADSYGSLLGPRPTQPAAVVLPSGESLGEDDVARLLPRLASISMQLSLVRRGRLAPWRVSRWQFAEAVVVTQTRDVTIGR